MEHALGGYLLQMFLKRPNASHQNGLTLKYGRVVEERVIGRGASSVVILCQCEKVIPGLNSKTFVAKQFSRCGSKHDVKKGSSEFCISSVLDHPNILKTLDLVQGKRGKWIEVMEWCQGGDLCSLIQSAQLTAEARDVMFLQIIGGVQYMHSMGIAHRDLKPENVLIGSNGLIKITDFGESEIVQGPFESHCRCSTKFCGSGPYISPEEYVLDTFDGKKTDIWALGVIYIVLAFSAIPFNFARMSDCRFRFFLSHIHDFYMYRSLDSDTRRLVMKMLEPDPATRVDIDTIHRDDWVTTRLNRSSNGIELVPYDFDMN